MSTKPGGWSNVGGVANSTPSCGDGEATSVATPGVCAGVVEGAVAGAGEDSGGDAGAELGEDGVAAGSSTLVLTGRVRYSTLNGSAFWAGVAADSQFQLAFSSKTTSRYTCTRLATGS